MPWLRRILMVLIIAVALVTLVGLFLPKTFHVERTVVIDAPPADIHAFTGDLRMWEEWTPWIENDPTIEITYGSTTTGEGASQSWVGDSGDGELTFTRCDEASGVAYDMAFDQGRYPSTGALVYAPDGGSTRVTWTMDGANVGITGRWMGLLMDSFIGPMFEQGLDKLKMVVEMD